MILLKWISEDEKVRPNMIILMLLSKICFAKNCLTNKDCLFGGQETVLYVYIQFIWYESYNMTTEISVSMGGVLVIFNVNPILIFRWKPWQILTIPWYAQGEHFWELFKIRKFRFIIKTRQQVGKKIRRMSFMNLCFAQMAACERQTNVHIECSGKISLNTFIKTYICIIYILKNIYVRLKAVKKVFNNIYNLYK